MTFRMPDKSTYAAKIKEVSDLFRNIVKDGSTAIGSGIYELLIRPMCIMYAAIEDSINTWYTDNTLQRLASSDNTTKGPADDILSNYFVYRKDGAQATGVVTLYSTDKLTKVPSGSVFTVQGIQLITDVTVYGSYDNFPEGFSAQDNYVKAYKSGEYYCFPVHVHTIDNSNVIVSEGSDVSVDTYIPSVYRAVLSSALVGGSDTETDASMVLRAKRNVSSWIGSPASIHKILCASGFPVYSSASFDNKDPEMNRAGSSALYINTGGMIDTYVKTSLYPLSGSSIIQLNGINTSNGYIDVTDRVPPATLCISGVFGDEGSPLKYDVIWGSSSPDISDVGARLSIYQTVKLALTGYSGKSITINYTYMPYIQGLQSYINKPDSKILGWDILIKAAVPVVTTIRGSIHTQTDDKSLVHKSIIDYINNTPVGISEINLSDIQHVLSYNYSTLLTSPVIMTTTDITYDGKYTSNMESSGVLKVPSGEKFTANIKFLCIESSGVLVE